MATGSSLNERPQAFKKGNKFGKGNPLAKQANQLRAALIKAVDRTDIERIAKSLVAQAISGDVPAAKELFDRLFGKANQPIQVEAPEGVNVVVTHKFDHARFAELFERGGASGSNGTGEAPGSAERN